MTTCHGNNSELAGRAVLALLMALLMALLHCQAHQCGIEWVSKRCSASSPS